MFAINANKGYEKEIDKIKQSRFFVKQYLNPETYQHSQSYKNISMTKNVFIV